MGVGTTGSGDESLVRSLNQIRPVRAFFISATTNVTTPVAGNPANRSAGRILNCEVISF
jgi:hypothetical protein